MRSRASSFNWQYPLLSLRSSSSFLRLLPRLLVTSIFPFIFPSITCCRRQFLRKMWPIQLAFRFLISCPLPPQKNPAPLYPTHRSQWPRGLSRGSTAARLLGLWVRIPPGTWTFVCCKCLQVEVSASGWSLVQRSPTDCDASLCVI